MANFYLDNKALKFHLHHPLMEKIVRLRERNFAEKDKFDYAPMDFEDAMENYEKVLEMVGGICDEIISENAKSIDEEGPSVVDGHVIYAKGTAKDMDVLSKAGLKGMSLPRQYGGLNFPTVPYIMTADLVSRADAGFVNIWGLEECAETLNEFASEEQKSKYLPRVCNGETMAMDLTEPDAGSDLQAVQLKATFDEKTEKWHLNGVKRFITNGDGDIALVLARSESNTKDGRGLSMFVYDKRNGGVTVRRIEHKMGIIGSPTCELVFKNAPVEIVGSRKLGLIKYVMALMNGARIGIAAQSVGICEAAYREALDYAKSRMQFGKAIIKFPAIYEMLSEMKSKLDASRTILYETARYVDIYKTYMSISGERKLEKEEHMEMKKYQKLTDLFTPLAKGLCSEFCNELAYDAIQIHGGSGFMKDYPVERIYRDARITSIYEGTTQLQVVAAIRGVTTGAYLKKIREYQQETVSPDLEKLKSILISLTDEYEEAVKKFDDDKQNKEWLDFHARRLVEMAGYIIMSYLLLLDSTRDSEFSKSASVFIHFTEAKVKDHVDFINANGPEELINYRYEE